MTEPQILGISEGINSGEKTKATRKQLCECVHYWALRCAFEAQARIALEDQLKTMQPKVQTGLVLPNGHRHNFS